MLDSNPVGNYQYSRKGNHQSIASLLQLSDQSLSTIENAMEVDKGALLKYVRVMGSEQKVRSQTYQTLQMNSYNPSCRIISTQLQVDTTMLMSRIFVMFCFKRSTPRGRGPMMSTSSVKIISDSHLSRDLPRSAKKQQ